MKKIDIWVVIDKNTGNPLEGHITEMMSPALRDFYNRSENHKVVQAVLVYEV